MINIKGLNFAQGWRGVRRGRDASILSAIAGVILVSTSALAADRAAVVDFSDGVVTVVAPGKAARVVGKGSELYSGDAISTEDRAFAVVEFTDGTKTTVRPNTAVQISQYRFQREPEQDGVALRLIKGGIRAITGLIGKSRPDAVSVTTKNATIGIRGTQFDARICEANCAGEKHKTPGQPVPDTAVVVGRVVSLSGPAASVKSANGATRTLAVGGAVFEADVVSTGPATTASLAFADKTAVTLAPSTQFEVSAWKYAGKAKSESNAALRLLAGAVRVVTGLIGKSNPESFSVRAGNSTIGIRGTGFDLNCVGDCTSATGAGAGGSGGGACGSKSADEPGQGKGLFAATWSGAIDVKTGACRVRVGKGQAAFVDPRTGETRYLPRVPAFMGDAMGQRPDGLQYDHDNLFRSAMLPEGADGFYAFVRDGHVRLTQGGGTIDLAPGEAGFSDASGGVPIRLASVPSFISDDPYPLPEGFDAGNGSVLELMRENARYYDDGKPGQCTIR